MTGKNSAALKEEYGDQANWGGCQTGNEVSEIFEGSK